MDILFAVFVLLGALILIFVNVDENITSPVLWRGAATGLLLLALGVAGLSVQRFEPPMVLVTLEDDPVKREVATLLEQPAGAPLHQIVAQYEPRCAVHVDQRFPLAVVMGVTRTQRFPRACDDLTDVDRVQIEALRTTLSRPL